MYVHERDYDALAERLRKEVSAAYGMAIRKQERIEQIEARLAEAERLLREVDEWGKDYDGAWNTLDRIEYFLRPADNAQKVTP
jgi:hypothetical protein